MRRTIETPTRLLSFLVFGVALVSTVEGGDWTAFRGSRGNGTAPDATPSLHWGREENILWRVPLPGTGNGSPIVVGSRVFLAYATEQGERRTLVCFDKTTGEHRWHRTVDSNAVELTHRSNPYCGSTPAATRDVVVVWHGSSGLHCYSVDGQPQWSVDLGEIRHLWGYGTSPIIHQDRVILHSGATDDIFTAAFRLTDGAEIWRVAELGGQTNETPDGKLTGSWSTPLVASDGQRDQIVCALPTRMVSYDPADGSVLWSCQGLSGSRGHLVYASPVANEQLVVAMAGYLGPAMAVDLGSSGEVTETGRVWHVGQRNPQRIGSGVAVGDFLYIGNADGGTIECVELASGCQQWKMRVRGGPHWASTVFAGGHLYATNQSGVTRVFRPNSAHFELVAENDLGEQINATPAFAGNQIVIRTKASLYCISESSQ